MHLARLFLITLSLLLPLATVCAGEGDWSVLIARHAERYPKLEAQDVYKLLVQATPGAEHAAPSETAALAWLAREVATLGEEPTDETLIEPITPDGALVRVHLRPFMSRGGDVRALARAFAATGRRKFGSREELAERWRIVETLAAAGRLPFGGGDAKALGARMAAAGWPAVHHTAAYRAAYRPAYRLVARELLAEVLPASE